ncbi:EF-hand calcium-binding domain-containing protein 1-like [Vespa velutina]|uniref:EF-hand calcium-binding domain-containing protein 1-like n=1 Tax=Vespa velutina TaxID=202808 RepID=UPI001FB3A15E|nr:EF-hand calcium-binding domain-containing protein 1-like [Vespa velutina]
MSNEKPKGINPRMHENKQTLKLSVGADVEGNGGVDAVHVTTTLMKSVSLFLTSAWKASVNIKRPSSVKPTKQEPRSPRKKKMPESGNARNSAYIVKVIESLKKKTKFNRTELDGLCKLYKKLMTQTGHQQVNPSMDIYRKPRPMHSVEGIDRSIFRDLLHNTFKVITEDTLVERLFCCWDRENEGTIKLESWIMGLDVFLRGNLQDKTDFCFRVYDLNNDGFITKDEIFQLFKNCLIKQPGEEDPDEGIRDLSELTLKKLDVNRDGKISFQDYETAIRKEPLLLEAFGQCLPTEENCTAFIKSLQY